MASTTAPSAALTSMPRAPGGPSARWDSLDVLRGVALCAMVAHHFAKWTGGRVGERFVGFSGFLLTDLAAPMFAVGVGAAGYLVGRQVVAGATIAWPRARRAAFRFGQILALGIAIDMVRDGEVDGGGVLPTLAVVGLVVMAASALGATRPTLWWAVAAVGVLAAVPVVRLGWTGTVGELVAGQFSVVVYGVFAAAGAAVAAAAHPAGERALPLLSAAAGVLAVGGLAAAAVPQWVAPGGIWPPDRYPGDLAFTLWGVSGTLVVWAAIRAWMTPRSRLGRGLARAGRRTLLVFGAHYLVRVALDQADLMGRLDTRAWGWATWAATAAVCTASMLPSVRRQR